MRTRDDPFHDEVTETMRPKKTTTKRILVAASLLTLVSSAAYLAACGGDDTSTTPSDDGGTGDATSFDATGGSDPGTGSDTGSGTDSGKKDSGGTTDGGDGGRDAASDAPMDAPMDVQITQDGGTFQDAAPGGDAAALSCGTASCNVPNQACCVYDNTSAGYSVGCSNGAICPDVVDAGAVASSTSVSLYCEVMDFCPSNNV
jgi:hypothetical protein